MKKIKYINGLLSVAVVMCVCICTGMFLAVEAKTQTTEQLPGVIGEVELQYAETVFGLDYYTGEHGTYLFRNGTLVGVEEPSAARSGGLTPQEQAYAAAAKYVDMSAYGEPEEAVYPGEIYEYTWRVYVDGIPTKDCVIADVRSDGTVLHISFPDAGLAKGLEGQKAAAKPGISREAAEEIFRAAAQKEYSNPVITFSQVQLTYNLDNILVWELIGGAEYQNADGVTISAYAAMEISAADGSVLRQQFG